MKHIISDRIIDEYMMKIYGHYLYLKMGLFILFSIDRLWRIVTHRLSTQYELIILYIEI